MPSIVNKLSKFTKREIDCLFNNARSVIKSQFCTILLAPAQKDFGRVLIITSRKVGNAPERNVLRRRIKSIFYEEKLFDRSCDCAVIVYRKAVFLSFEQLKDLLLTAFQKGCTKNENPIS